MLDDLDQSTSHADYKTVGKFTRDDENKLIGGFEFNKDKTPDEIYEHVITCCLEDLPKCSSTTLEKIFSLSVNVYLAFISPAVLKRLTPKASTILAECAVTLFKNKKINDSPAQFPTSLLFDYVFPFFGVPKLEKSLVPIVTQRLAKALLNDKANWGLLNSLPSDIIEQCLYESVQMPDGQRKVLIEAVDVKILSYSNIRAAVHRGRFEALQNSLSEKEFEQYLKEHLNNDVRQPEKSTENLRVVEALILYLPESVKDVKDIEKNIHRLTRCLVHLMHFSQPHEGLKINPLLLRRKLVLINSYISNLGDVPAFCEETLLGSEFNLLSYIRRTIKGFNDFNYLAAMVFMCSSHGVRELTDAQLSEYAKKGALDVQALLKNTANRMRFDAKKAERLITVGHANMDTADEKNQSFRDYAIAAAGRFYRPSDAALEFYIEQKIKAGHTLAQLLGFFGRELLNPHVDEYLRGCVRSIQILRLKYNARAIPEVILNIKDNFWRGGPALKNSVLDALLLDRYWDQGLPPLPEDQLIAEFRAVSAKSVVDIMPLMGKRLEVLNHYNLVKIKYIVRLSMNIYFAFLSFFHHHFFIRDTTNAVLASVAFELYCEGKLKHVSSEFPPELAKFLLEDRQPQLIFIKNGGQEFLDALHQTIIPGENEHLELLQLLIGYLVDDLEKTRIPIPFLSNDAAKLKQCLEHLMRFSAPEEGLKLKASVLRRCLKVLDREMKFSPAWFSYVRRTIGNFDAFPVLKKMLEKQAVTDVLKLPTAEAKEAIKAGRCDIQGQLLACARAPEFLPVALFPLMAYGARLDITQDGESFCSIALIEAGRSKGQQVEKLRFYLDDVCKRHSPTEALEKLLELMIRADVEITEYETGKHYFYGYIMAIQLLVLEYGAYVTPTMVNSVREQTLVIATTGLSFTYSAIHQEMLTLLEEELRLDLFRDQKALNRLREALGKENNDAQVGILLKRCWKSLTYLMPHEKKQLCDHPAAKSQRELLANVDDDFKDLIDRKIALDALVIRDQQRFRKFWDAVGYIDENKLPNRMLFF